MKNNNYTQYVYSYTTKMMKCQNKNCNIEKNYLNYYRKI